jgi:hypothetical protein
MIITLILVLAGLVALGLLVHIARKRASTARSPETLARRIQPVDIEAFRNLVDLAEEEYLRTHLAPSQFRAVQRQRLRAAVEYVACAARNAEIMVNLGEAARRSSEVAVADAGAKLVDSAVRLRMFALRARAKLYVGILFPGVHISPAGLPESYERMNGIVLLLGRLQQPDRSPSAAL